MLIKKNTWPVRVTIGEGAVVGVRSTVLGDLPGGMVCYGNPARAVKERVQNR